MPIDPAKNSNNGDDQTRDANPVDGKTLDNESKVDRQIRNAGLPTGGTYPFDPQLGLDKYGKPTIKKAPITHGPKRGKKGYLDKSGRIWIKDHAHGKYPDHWDVQEDGGKKGYTRVDPDGNIL